MEEVRRLKPNGLVAASTFSGCGGSSLGYRMAGFRVAYANEFVEAARDTYRANASFDTFVDGRDIREVLPIDILGQIGIGKGELDLLDGSPPCASFSSAGKGSKLWGVTKKYSDTEQRTDDLFFEFARLLAGIQPKTFVAENVAGLARGAAAGYFREIFRALQDAGYRVNAKMLDAQWLGVPQQRRRVIFVGVRNDIGIAPAFPRPFSYTYSIEEALEGLKAEVPKEVWLDGYSTGKQWYHLRQGEQSTRYFSLIRADPRAPCPTLTTVATGSPAGVAHHSECRKYSPAELKRICAFPDDFVLTGTVGQQGERLGRAVPPLMMKAIAEAVRDQVLFARHT